MSHLTLTRRFGLTAGRTFIVSQSMAPRRKCSANVDFDAFTWVEPFRDGGVSSVADFDSAAPFSAQPFDRCTVAGSGNRLAESNVPDLVFLLKYSMSATELHRLYCSSDGVSSSTINDFSSPDMFSKYQNTTARIECRCRETF